MGVAGGVVAVRVGVTVAVGVGAGVGVFVEVAVAVTVALAGVAVPIAAVFHQYVARAFPSPKPVVVKLGWATPRRCCSKKVRDSWLMYETFGTLA